jgi:exopolyphosphatase/guanosine-5'-triphosphate,3'-diphosphate pyrophosphatase
MNSEQLQALKRLAKEKNYGGSPEHAKQVMRLSIRIYKELLRLGALPKLKSDRRILRSAALLHNTGLPEEPHNETGFDLLRVEIPRALSKIPLAPEELSTILYCVLWHRGRTFNRRGKIEIDDPPRVRRLAAILRVADALDRSFSQIVEDVSLSLIDGRLIFSVSSAQPAEDEIQRAEEKADLMREAYDVRGIEFAHASLSYI